MELQAACRGGSFAVESVAAFAWNGWQASSGISGNLGLEYAQSLGADAEYVKIEGNGPNALDFHIAFYMGNISAKDPDCYFHVISKDTGFDPLIKHLKTKRIYAQREKDISEIPLLKISNSKSMAERIDAIVEFLKVRGAAKPRAVKTLSNSINSLFMKKLEEDELGKIMDELIRQKIVVTNGSKVTYQLPGKP